MHGTRWLVLLAGIAFWALPAGAQPILTLEEAMREAMRNNPRLRAEQARLNITAAEITRAATRPNPALITDNANAEETYRLGIANLLELGGKRRKRMNLAESLMEITRAEVTAKIADFRKDVKQAYLELYTLQAEQEALEDVMTELALATRPAAREIEAALYLARLGNRARQLEVALLAARNRLSILLNNPVPSATRLEEPSFDLDDLQPPALLLGANVEAEEPEVSPERQAAQRQLELAQANRIPDFFFEVGPSMVTYEGRTNFGVYVMTSVDLPIFDRNQGEIEEALAVLELVSLEEAADEQAEAILEAGRREKLALEVSQVQQYREEILPQTQGLRKQALKDYQEGNRSLALLLEASQTWLDVYRTYLERLGALFQTLE